ncbi:MAG: hypothetical protein ABFC34_01895 [Methanobacterium sp.]
MRNQKVSIQKLTFLRDMLSAALTDTFVSFKLQAKLGTLKPVSDL